MTNIRFIEMDLLELPQLNKKFDLIECSGVLHHMKNPEKGLTNLIDSLEAKGFLKLGLYSKFARKEILKEKELIKETVSQEESKLSQNLHLDDIWEKVIAMLELPSTKMLLSQQAKLINLNSDSAEIAISEKWINMIQSRKNLIEDAFYKARGSSTKVLLIQQKDALSNNKNENKTHPKIEQKNQLEIGKEPERNNFREKKLDSKSNLETNSIDQKAKQFADFFNGEIVNLE